MTQLLDEINGFRPSMPLSQQDEDRWDSLVLRIMGLDGTIPEEDWDVSALRMMAVKALNEETLKAWWAMESFILGELRSKDITTDDMRIVWREVVEEMWRSGKSGSRH